MTRTHIYRSLDKIKGRGSRADALRVVRDFEEINGVPFNPKNRAHMDTCRDMGTHKSLIRALRLKFDRWRKPEVMK